MDEAASNEVSEGRLQLGAGDVFLESKSQKVSWLIAMEIPSCNMNVSEAVDS